MLRQFRKGADGFFAKLLLLFLVLTFALWGVGDIFRGAPENVIAMVDEQPITMEELEFAIREGQTQIPQLTPEVAQAPQVRLQFLQQIINSRLLQAEAKALGIDFSEAELSKRIADDPSFQDENGAFDRQRFLTLLAQNNISQAGFLRRFEDDLQVSLLHSAIALTTIVPPEMVKLYYHVLNEQREASLILLGEKDIKPVGTPDDQDLEALYKSRREQFRRAEYRTYRTVSFDAETISEITNLTPDEAVLRSYYESHADQFEQQESVSLIQLSFEDQVAASTAYEALGKRTNKEAIAKYMQTEAAESGELNEIGRFTRMQLPLEGKQAEQVFSASVGALSEPFETPFGWNLYFVSARIEPGIRSFEMVKEDIRSRVMQERLGERITELSNQLDDALAGGATLEEALAQAGLQALSIEVLGPISATNEMKNGETLMMTPSEQEMLEIAFEQDTGEISPITMTGQDDYVVVETLEIIPSTIAPFETVKAELKQQWKQIAQQRAIARKAANLAAELKQAEHPLAAAKERGLSLHSTGMLTRQNDRIGADSQLSDMLLGPDFMDAMFALQPNEVSAPVALASNEHVAIAILERITPAKEPTASQLEPLRQNLRRQLEQETIMAYLTALRARYNVEIFMDKIAMSGGVNG